jgi:hypothetical protein
MNKLICLILLMLLNGVAFTQSEKEEITRLRRENERLQQLASANQAKAMAAEKNAQRLRYQAIAHTLGEVSLVIKDKQLAGLLALQAMRFNVTYGGYDLDYTIYSGLVEALKRFGILPINFDASSQNKFPLSSNQSNDQFSAKPETNGDIILHNGRTDGYKFRLSAHSSKVTLIRFSNSGDFMVSADGDGFIFLWNLKDQSKRPMSLKESGAVQDIIFSNNDQQLLVKLAKSNIAHIWPLNVNELAHELENILTRNLTKEEWARFVAPDLLGEYEKTVPRLPEGY